MTRRVAVLDSKILAASSILGALKPEDKLLVKRNSSEGMNTRPALPVTAKGFCLISVKGKLKNEQKEFLLDKNRKGCLNGVARNLVEAIEIIQGTRTIENELEE